MERSRRAEEVRARKSAAIVVTYEHQASSQPGHGRYDVVIENIGKCEARDVDLMRFNSRDDGTNGREIIKARGLLPIPRLSRRARIPHGDTELGLGASLARWCAMERRPRRARPR
jgi:hypothetical protein